MSESNPWRMRLPSSLDKEQPLPARIAAHIGGLIADGTLAPGASLPGGRELAALLGVSRPAVREAVGRLEALGLVSVRPRLGVFVAVPAPVETEGEGPVGALPAILELEDLFEVRRLLEPAAAGWAARRGDADAVGRVRRAALSFAQTANTGSVARMAGADIALHLEIATCAGNAVLERLVERLYDPRRLELEWSLRRRGRLEEAVAEHARIVDAVVAHAPEQAASAMRAHLEAAEAAARSRFEAEAGAID